MFHPEGEKHPDERLSFDPPRIFARLGGRHALVVTTKDLANLGVVDRAERSLRDAGLTVTRFDDVQPDPTCEAVDRAASGLRAASADIIVALGGGSAIDFAKALSAAATHDGPIWDYVTYTGANAKPLGTTILPLIAIPTTAGTGSEVSQGSVLDNPVLEMKAALLSPRMYPRVALVDPELTYTMPPRTTAMTGFDALTHGIESFLNVQRTTPASELFALEAVRRAAANLPVVVRDGGNQGGPRGDGLGGDLRRPGHRAVERRGGPRHGPAARGPAWDAARAGAGHPAAGGARAYVGVAAGAVCDVG